MKTSRIVIIMTAFVLATVMLFAACNGEPSEPTETKAPVQSEPVQAEPVQTEPAQTESAQTEPTAPEGAAAGIYEAIAAKASFPEMMSVSGDMILDFYGIDPSTYTDEAVYMSIDNLLADEAAVFIAKDEAAAESIEELLNSRQQMKADEAKGYSSEQYKIITESGVVRNGLYVALIVTANYADAVEAYNGLTAK